MRLNIIIFEGLKHSYLLTAKIAPDGNIWEYFIKEWGHFLK